MPRNWVTNSGVRSLPLTPLQVKCDISKCFPLSSASLCGEPKLMGFSRKFRGKCHINHWGILIVAEIVNPAGRMGHKLFHKSAPFFRRKNTRRDNSVI